MALDIALQENILELTKTHWVTHAQDQGFTEIIQGKEPGHRMADYVDDRTCALLKVHLDTRYEGDKKGNVRKRSMGDIWVHSQGIFNPINVKSGLQDMNGQPNLVSMRKLLDYIFKRWIDSYYLLIIKFDVSAEPTHKAYLVDILDWTDFITYDAGPGQIMLRERDFYGSYESGYTPPNRTVPEKADILFTLFEQQLEALFANRRERLARQRAMLTTFRSSAFTVNQSEMRFVA
ncbi:MAG: hypothetical protein OXU64_01985 [Gemmatimonadota bacterium]|nr:hypothetical protein [Gemmatimonadota bacterium]